ncbi:MAG: transcriptional repressor LexA [Gammaproteobacteria bacterium]|nr:transcriptional repressor LexA [Gammaproteobacteria bacterium]
MVELTARQAEILELIQSVIEDTGMPPTRAEIAQSLGFKSANAAEEHLRALAKKGMIELVPGASRGIRLLDVPEAGLPLIGRVAAGMPILAEQNIETRYRVDSKLFSPTAHYLLKVHGMSMRDAGILDGDLLAVHRSPDVRNGQIIVARLNEDEVTVKRYKQRGKEVWLLPENPEFEPIHVDLAQESMVIEGVVVGVVRNGHIQ